MRKMLAKEKGKDAVELGRMHPRGRDSAASGALEARIR